MSQIRVLYCIEAMVHGGTEKQLAALIRALDRDLIEPSLCVLKPSTMDLASLGCEVIDLAFTSFRKPAAIGCLLQLRRFMIDRQIDVVQTYFQDPTLVGWLASLGTPVRARVAAFRDMGFWRTAAKVAQLRAAYPAFHGFLANSPAVARHVHEADGIPLEKIEVIPNGVVMPPQRPPRSGASAPVIGVVANLDRPVKRVDLFLDAARIVKQAIPDARFVIAGDGHLRPKLTARAERLEIAQSVTFLGSVEDVATEIRMFDIGVICSDSEGLSNAILEYMAAGVPTVARAVGGNADAVIDGETGLLVKSSRPEALARAILELLTDEPARLRMGAAARAAAEQAFSMEACVHRHQAYYAGLLERRALSAGRFAWSPR
jgi:glycosyltransferase involved in cell wall biosynthesis